MLYYFLPKQAEQPIWSYRLSIVAFWAFVYTYIWAGPHHLHYHAIPEWLQSLGMVMSLILLAPSWATMVNGIMTVSGAAKKLKTDPALKFIVLALAFYGLATFEGPMLAIKSVNVFSHFTEWTIGHVHSGALGWNALITFGTYLFHGARAWRARRCTACGSRTSISGWPSRARCFTCSRCGARACRRACCGCRSMISAKCASASTT